MKRKITLLLLSALLVSGMANAQHGFKSEPIWAYSWGVGMGTMVPQGNLATHFNPGFALDTEVGGYYHDLFLMVNGGFSTSKIAKDIPVGESRWPAGTGSIHAFIGTNLGDEFRCRPIHYLSVRRSCIQFHRTQSGNCKLQPGTGYSQGQRDGSQSGNRSRLRHHR